MRTTDVRDLKEDPAATLRQAVGGPVLIQGGGDLDALLVNLAAAGGELRHLRPAVAADLYKNGCLSLGSASEVSGLSLGDFITHLGTLGVEVVGMDETTHGEAKDVSSWLSS